MEEKLKTASFIATLLDSQFRIFGMRFGITAVFDIIPELGDIIAASLSLYLVCLAVQLKVPLIKIVVMVMNILVNFIFGSIPVVGEFIYVFNKANLKNLAIIKAHVQQTIA